MDAQGEAELFERFMNSSRGCGDSDQSSKVYGKAGRADLGSSIAAK
jgi:hypothetical protein